MKQAILGSIVKYTGLGSLQRRLLARKRATIAIYHDPQPDLFDKHLAWFAERYNFITMNQLADALESGQWERLPDYPLVITLDDGHIGNTRLQEVMRRHNVRPLIYLCSQIVGTWRPYWWQTEAAAQLGAANLKRLPDNERRQRLAAAGNDPDSNGPSRQSMSWDEIAEMGNVVDFGAHTRTHPILPNCDDRRCEEEIVHCKQDLDAALGIPCQHFAFPNGDYGQRELDLLRRAGYRTARSIEPGWNGPNADPLLLKAFPVSDDSSVDWLAVQMTGLPAWLRSRNRPSLGPDKPQTPDLLPAL